MSARIRRHLRSNVIAYVALFAALSGTAIAAAPRNSVTSKSIKNGAVHKEDVGANAIDSSKVQDASLTGDDIASNSLNGVDINGPTLTGVDADTLNGISSDDLQFGNGVDVGGGTTTFSGTDVALGTPDGTLDVTCAATPTAAYTDGGADGSQTFVWTTRDANSTFDNVSDGGTSGPLTVADEGETTIVLFSPSNWVISAHMGISFQNPNCVVAITAQLNA